MIVAGYHPNSTIDYPDNVSFVVYTQGCPWCCPFCYNHSLRNPNTPGNHSVEEILNEIDKRKKLLDAVVLTGGEPTIQEGLKEFLMTIKEMRLKTAIHTGGYNPEVISDIINHVDWIGLDCKIQVPDYERVTGDRHSGKSFLMSLRTIVDHAKETDGFGFEVRTTLYPKMLTPEILMQMSDTLREEDVSNWKWQNYRDDEQNEHPLGSEFNNVIEYCKKVWPNLEIR